MAEVTSIVSLDPRLTLAQYQLMYSNPAAIADPYISQSLQYLAGVGYHAGAGRQPLWLCSTRAPRRWCRRSAHTPPPAACTCWWMAARPASLTTSTRSIAPSRSRCWWWALITYLALMLLFRSLVLPLKAIVMNLLSIVAALWRAGLHLPAGPLQQLLNFTPLGFVEASAPILMFCALFGLSMDYEVFLLSRIREAYEQTGDNTAQRGAGAGAQRRHHHQRGGHCVPGQHRLRLGGYGDRQGAGRGHGAGGAAGRDAGAGAAGAGDDAAARQRELVVAVAVQPLLPGVVFRQVGAGERERVRGMRVMRVLRAAHSALPVGGQR